jgi:hypothetical protein
MSNAESVTLQHSTFNIQHSPRRQRVKVTAELCELPPDPMALTVAT